MGRGCPPQAIVDRDTKAFFGDGRDGDARMRGRGRLMKAGVKTRGGLGQIAFFRKTHIAPDHTESQQEFPGFGLQRVQAQRLAGRIMAGQLTGRFHAFGCSRRSEIKRTRAQDIDAPIRADRGDR